MTEEKNIPKVDFYATADKCCRVDDIGGRHLLNFHWWTPKIGLPWGKLTLQFAEAAERDSFYIEVMDRWND